MTASPTSFDLERLLAPQTGRTPQMQAIHEWLLQEDAGLPDWLSLPAAEGRALAARLNRRWNAELPPVASVTPLRLPGATGGPAIPAQMIEPPDALPGCILFLHGGGWAFCDLDTHQGLMRRLALATRRKVLGIDYRLAPEHPYPAPLADCIAGWRWLADESGIAGPFGVAGDSAGANLALALVLGEQAAGRRVPDAALLFYGIFAADLDSPSYRRFATGYGLTRERMRRFFDWYVPQAQRVDPLVSPIEASDAEFAALPPLFLNAAGLDPLLCDTLAMVERLQRIGARHEFVLHPGLHHGFMLMSSHLPAADEAIGRAAAFFRDAAVG
jgi:acetyl esterase